MKKIELPYTNRNDHYLGSERLLSVFRNERS